MNLLSISQLSKLTTPRLLAYKKTLMTAPETPSYSGEEYVSKADDSWKLAYDELKAELATREHVEKKDEQPKG